MSDRNEAGNHPLFTVLTATLVVVACIGAYVWFNNKPPVHTGDLLSVTAYPIHRELTTGSGLGGLNGGNNVIDEVIVIASVKIRSQTELPLFLNETFGEVTLASGQVQQSRAAGPEDFNKVFVAYPALSSQKGTPVPNNITMKPGQQIEGQLIFHYPITQQDWDARQGFRVRIEFIHQKDLVLQQPGPHGQQPSGSGQ